MQLSFSARLALAALAAVLVLAGALAAILAFQLSDSGRRETAAVTSALAETLSRDPGVPGLVRARDSEALQPFAEAVMDEAHLSFVTFMTPDGTRLTHRDPAEIGRPYLGSREEALAGESFTEVYEGTLGPSMRTIVPVRDGGEIVGLLSVGETLGSVEAELAPRVPLIVAASAAIVSLGVLGALFVRRSARRVTGTLTPEALGRMVENYETVLHSIREGLIVTDASGRIRMYNDEAADLLDLPPARSGLIDVDPADLVVDDALRDALLSGRRVVEETIANGERVLLVNQEEARDLTGQRAGQRGRVMTLRDRSELRALIGELDGVRQLTETLRSQTHEHGNRLHTVLALLELGRVDDARRLIIESTEGRQGLADRLVAGSDDAVVLALLLGKLDDAAEHGVHLDLDVDEPTPHLPFSAAETVTVIGNLVDNALDAANAGPRPAWARLGLHARADMIELVVVDSGTGFDPSLDDPFAFGASTKGADAVGSRGVGLALLRDVVTARGGTISITTDPTTVTVTVGRAAP
ncbi:sensor histidine kinase regulating citrate/malate metabolism [Microbacterium sp. AG1240]|uniref:sensor histidine kinase n=1 Tax=Microbacterium sp. AG1240 TaxID=2183992 RepID=UPI000EAE9A06|nr:ATP-binding protein [Microbacterium sp. AG1240]RKT35699.1 sensor histidine kinase regulating citrate/malate metabolism [Microbacterium sp. AG1240]